MLVEERRSRLLELVRQRRFASLPELVEALRVSESTIRRDLEQLEEQGTAKRIHGGVLYAGGSPKLPHFEGRQPARWEQKQAIARRTVELIDDGDTVLLDGGSTTFEVARLLVGRPLHVVTTSLPVANLFAADSGSDLVVIGGNICPRSGVAQGPVAEKMISELRVGKTVLSVAGITEEVSSTTTCCWWDGTGDDGGRRGGRGGPTVRSSGSRIWLGWRPRPGLPGRGRRDFRQWRLRTVSQLKLLVAGGGVRSATFQRTDETMALPADRPQCRGADCPRDRLETARWRQAGRS